MVIILVKEGTLIIVVKNLDFGIRNVALEAMELNRYGTFDQIANRSMENPNYAYLYSDLLNKIVLTKITLKVKSFHIKMHEQHL
jgi:hypothetical protein